MQALDESLAKAREALAGTTDETVKNWRLRVGGPGRNEQPRHIMLCDDVFAHLAHHCRRLTVYLRLLDVPYRQLWTVG